MAKNKERPVIVRADKRVVFDDVVQVLDVTKNAGVRTLGIAIEEKPSRSPSNP
jgi:biopolymer transport protein ExbD